MGSLSHFYSYLKELQVVWVCLPLDQIAASGNLILGLPVADSAVLSKSEKDWYPKAIESQDILWDQNSAVNGDFLVLLPWEAQHNISSQLL